MHIAAFRHSSTLCSTYALLGLACLARRGTFKHLKLLSISDLCVRITMCQYVNFRIFRCRWNSGMRGGKSLPSASRNRGTSNRQAFMLCEYLAATYTDWQ